MIRKRRSAGRIAWGVALAVLAFALVWFNFIEADPVPAVTAEPSAETQAETEAVVGSEIGNLLPDFETELLGGGTFRQWKQ